jgi:hypothetical protein
LYQIHEATSISSSAEHPIALIFLLLLSLSLKKNEQDPEALDRMIEYRDRNAKVLGVDHPDTKEASRKIQMWQTQVLDN